MFNLPSPIWSWQNGVQLLDGQFDNKIKLSIYFNMIIQGEKFNIYIYLHTTINIEKISSI